MLSTLRQCESSQRAFLQQLRRPIRTADRASQSADNAELLSATSAAVLSHCATGQKQPRDDCDGLRIASVPGIFLAKAEMDAIRDRRAPQSGENLAKWAFYLSIAATAIWILGICVYWSRFSNPYGTF
jgi:hypothetical protein